MNYIECINVMPEADSKQTHETEEMKVIFCIIINQTRTTASYAAYFTVFTEHLITLVFVKMKVVATEYQCHVTNTSLDVAHMQMELYNISRLHACL